MTLQDFLQDTYPELSWAQADTAFGERVGATRQTICRYRKFQRNPSPVMIARIRDETGGLVNAEDHLPPHLRAGSSRRKPGACAA